MNRAIIAIALVLVATNARSAQPKTIDVAVTGDKEDLKNAIVAISLPEDFGNLANKTPLEVSSADGKSLIAQVEPFHMDGKRPSPTLYVLIPELKAGQKIDLKVKINGKSSAEAREKFEWGEVDGMEQLHFNKRPILRYFHQPFDAKLSEKGKEIANPSTKPYHHLFASDGKTIVTNSNQGQYPHHRGIFFGFNNISYDSMKADVWHCRNGEHTAHEKVLTSEAGSLFGRQALQIAWKGTDGKTFATEVRELTVYNVPGGILIDFDSQLTTPLDKVRLDGDPQHAGFHFRANSAMEKNTKETIFIRPDGKGKAGEEKNWDPKTKKGPINLAWDAMSFVLEGKRYTVVYLDHPDNPKQARQSERTYGRIGTYFEYDLTPQKPLKVRYRLWFQDGEPTIEQCETLSKAFVNTPKAKIQQ